MTSTTDQPRKDLRSFDRSLPMALLRAREAVMKKFIPSLKAHGLSPQQWRVIRALESEDGLELSELSERCFLLMPSLTRIIKNLESRDIVRRRSVPQDQRRSAIYLRPLGRKLFAAVAPKSVERYEYIGERFGAENLALLYELLENLVAQLEDSEDTDE